MGHIYFLNVALRIVISKRITYKDLKLKREVLLGEVPLEAIGLHMVLKAWQYLRSSKEWTQSQRKKPVRLSPEQKNKVWEENKHIENTEEWAVSDIRECGVTKVKWRRGIVTNGESKSAKKDNGN